jgi:protein TonB
MYKPALSASASPPYANHFSPTGGGKNSLWSPDHFIPLLAVIAVHLGMIAWIAHVSMQNQPLLALPASVMTGILIAPPAPKPAVPPKPKPHVDQHPVVPPPKPKPQVVKPAPAPIPPPNPVVDPAPAPKPAPPPVVTEAPPPPAFTAPPAEVKKPEPAPPPVIPPRVDASQLNNPIPPYPSISRRLGEEGKVLLDVDILADGSVGEVKIKTSSGYPRLDQAALEAVKHWHYVPASRGGQPISYWYVQPIVFSLRN